MINVAQSHNTLLLSTFMAKDNEEDCVPLRLPTFLLTRSSYRENIWLVNYYYLWVILQLQAVSRHLSCGQGC